MLLSFLSFFQTLDTSAFGVAAPTIARDLHV
jgi:hypothetical protein